MPAPVVRLFRKGELKKTGAACSREQAVVGGRYRWGKCVSRKFALQIAAERANRDYMLEYDIIISSLPGHQRRVGAQRSAHVQKQISLELEAGSSSKRGDYNLIVGVDTMMSHPLAE